jgi:hypothetical protein
MSSAGHIEPVFVTNDLYPPMLARALDALRALEVCVSADAVRDGTVDDVPFTQPEGSTLREADALTLRMRQRENADRIVHAIVDQTYGPTIARALYASLYRGAETNEYNMLMRGEIPFVPYRINVEYVLYRLGSARRAVFRIVQYGPEAPVPLPPNQGLAALRRKYLDSDAFE